MPGDITPTVQVDRVAKIRICEESGTSDELDTLGYTRNGAEVSFQGFFLDVPGDENGGDDGPPVDVQFMGETATIRLELTKYVPAIAEQLESRFSNGSGGTPGAAGTLMFGESPSVSWRVLILTTNRVRNFLRAFPRNVIELNKGTRFSTLVVEFEAHKGAGGVLWNTSVA